MTTTNPLPIWLHSNSPAEMVKMIGGEHHPCLTDDCPHWDKNECAPIAKQLERWVNVVVSLWDKRTGITATHRDDVYYWIEYFESEVRGRHSGNRITHHEGCSLLRCIVPPPRTCPGCYKELQRLESIRIVNSEGEVCGWKRRKDRDRYSELKTCQTCNSKGTGIICEPPAIDPCWLSSTVVDLVRLIRGKYRTIEYEEMDGISRCGICDPPDYSKFPLLHDALMDAGCDDEAVLRHCLDGTHTAGCWLLDSLLAGRG